MESDENGTDSSRCFVPEILIDLLSKQISQGRSRTIPTSHFVHGVCLLVDISGFTKLSCDFCADGKNGIDGLQLATNGYMGKLVEVIYMFGGDIIKFAGDAIICLFPTTLVTKLIKTKHGKMLRRSVTADMDAILRSRDAAISNVTNANIVGLEDSCHSNNSHLREGMIQASVMLRAMHCANKLKTITQDTLTVHVAISCGEMCFGVLGGFEDRWECLISGPCLQELSACLDEAPSKQAVMTAGCFNVLRQAQGSLSMSYSSDDNTPGKMNQLGGYKYSVVMLPSGNFTITNVFKMEDENASLFFHSSSLQIQNGPPNNAPPATPKQRIQDHFLAGLVMQFVPTIIASGIKQGTGLSYISEIREVTTMFMKWDAYDVNCKHRDLIELQDGFFEAQRILYATGAYLRQFLVDDKGCVLIACWGMPSQTYLDNAHRALTAAVEIRTALLELQMKCSFGITTGDVYCGTVGSALRMEYAAIGSVVNMSARLMGKAHGGILIDEPTYLRLPTAAQLLLEKLTPLQVKGRVEPLQVYEHGGISSTLAATDCGENFYEGVLELRDCCRETLTSLLDRLTDVRKQRRVRGGALQMLMNPFGVTASPAPSPRKTATIASVLLEGKQGTGCKASTSWLCKLAQKRNIYTAYVKVADKTYLSNFYLLFKIFAQLGPKDLYSSKSCQRRYVHALLREVYPDDGDMAVQVAFPIMKQTLAVTCTYSRDPSVHDSNNSSLSLSSRSHGSNSLYQRSIKLKENKFPTRLMTDVLVTIFTHLLTERTVLVIIDDIHLADEESLRVLVELLKIADSKSAIVMSAVPCGDQTATETAASSVQAGGEESFLEVQDVAVGAWASRIYPVVVSNHRTTVIAVDVFTTAEIAVMLSTLPESAQFPPNLPLLVQTLSGGEFAWIKEILRFLQDFGASRLQTVVGDHSLPTATTIKTRTNMKNFSLKSSITEKVTVYPTERRSVSVSTQRFNHSPVKASLTHIDNPAPLEGFKIDQLVVCRYENLRLSTKHILRTASIIGRSFLRQVLYGVLPRSLKAELTGCLHTLVQHQWLQQSAEEPELYEFRYEYSYQVIYNITPESERRNLHKVIADYIEEISAGDASQAAQLSYHYGMCDADKALFHTYIAVSSMLESCAPLEMCECIDLLFIAVPHCTSLRDVEVLHMLATRATSKTREYSSPSKPITYRVRRAVRHLRYSAFSRLMSCWQGKNGRAVGPGGFEVADFNDIDAAWSADSEDSNTVLSQNTQTRNYFISLLHQLVSLLEKRKLEILQGVHTGSANTSAIEASTAGTSAVHTGTLANISKVGVVSSSCSNSKDWQTAAILSLERAGSRYKG